MKPLFSEIVDATIIRSGNVFTLTPNRGNKPLLQEAPIPLMCVVFAIRHALQFFSGHRVLVRAIWNLENKFVCFVLFPTAGIERSEELDYYRTVGFERGTPYDFRKAFIRVVENTPYAGTIARKWRWRTIDHLAMDEGVP